MAQTLHELFLLRAESVRVGGVNGGEVSVAERILLAVKDDGALGEVDIVEELAVGHLPLGVLVQHGALQLELYDGDGLVHTSQQLEHLVGVGLVVGVDAWHEVFNVIIFVGLHGKGDQGNEVDAVAFLKSCHIGIAQREAQDGGYADRVAGGSAHPHDVVVAPLDVEVGVIGEHLHDQVGARTAVVDVAEDMELVDAEALNHVAHGFDEVFGLTGEDDCLDDTVEVGLLLVVVRRLVEELFNDVGIAAGQGLTHLRARIFGRYGAHYLHQLVERNLVEVGEVCLRLLNDFQLWTGIVDERAQLFNLAVAHGCAEDFGDLAFDVA